MLDIHYTVEDASDKKCNGTVTINTEGIAQGDLYGRLGEMLMRIAETLKATGEGDDLFEAFLSFLSPEFRYFLRKEAGKNGTKSTR